MNVDITRKPFPWHMIHDDIICCIYAMPYLYVLYERRLLTIFVIARDNLTTSAIPGSTVLLNAFLTRCKQMSKIPSLNYNIKCTDKEESIWM